ncbi:MAG: hypothetical protein Ct9H300mP11_00380 [Chloroflexota bacterium]|nr:MAG: hypothetical protein Ct9H300mP11_00380 [Chloroflexota bacterium]
MIRSTAILAMGAVLILLLAACGSDTAVPQATYRKPPAPGCPKRLRFRRPKRLRFQRRRRQQHPSRVLWWF